MRKYFLLLITFLSIFYLSQNASALNACDTCTPSPVDPCASYYSSGNTCYYGMTCKSGGVSFSQNWCMSYSTAVSRTGTLDPNKEYCSATSPSPTHFEGYVNKDSSDPRTDVQCQDKVCGSSGWYKTNKPDYTTVCTYSGQPSTCLSGICQSALPPVTCNNNLIQDSGETGVDCGGGGCPDCAVTPPPTTCTNPSSYYTDYDCTSGGCKWCSFGDSGACKSLSDSCPGIGITDNCNAQTSKSACDAQSGGSTSFDCGWCPNSYSGGTSANGGSCIKAENLAANCGG